MVFKKIECMKISPPPLPKKKKPLKQKFYPHYNDSLATVVLRNITCPITNAKTLTTGVVYKKKKVVAKKKIRAVFIRVS